ncbi:MAG: ribonuclease HIII [Bacilli bacterium]|nr:ribonuclease HIII [Bacilli bacterium]
MKLPPEVYSIEPNEETLDKMRSFYGDMASESPNEYIDIFYQAEGLSVAIYKKNKKGHVKVVFQGPNAKKEVQIWDKDAKGCAPKAPKSPLAGKIINVFPQIGSDEVGTGDFFGPICVCAAFVKDEDLEEIKALGITDSKLMTDEYILEIGPRLIKRFDYNHLALPNEKYNEVHDDMNMNAIKAKMHNRSVLNLLKKHHGVAVYQDQFAEEKLYYKYLKDEPEVAKGIKFSTKGEKLFPSVALGSVIARYSFLRKMKEMSEQYGVKFPFGASAAVTKFAKQFAKKFGKDELKKVAKLNFANYKEIE